MNAGRYVYKGMGTFEFEGRSQDVEYKIERTITAPVRGSETDEARILRPTPESMKNWDLNEQSQPTLMLAGGSQLILNVVGDEFRVFRPEWAENEQHD
jgi:hypothetical protein